MSHFVTGVSKDLQKECNSSILHDNMNISHLMVHAIRIEEARSKRKIDMLKEQNHFMEVLRIIGLKYKTSQDLLNDFQIKSL